MEISNNHRRQKDHNETEEKNNVDECKDDLVPFKKLPAWLSDNNYIRESHRPQMPSVFCCFMSIFRIHSETVNIWTHLIGSIIYLTVAVNYFVDNNEAYSSTDKAMFLIYFSGAVACMSCSWIFHTLLCHSEQLGLFLNKLDYCGISCLVVGSSVPWIYYTFYCDVTIQFVYMTFIVFLSFIVIMISMFDQFATPIYRPVRAIIFIVLGLSTVVPGIHGFLKFGMEEANLRMSMMFTLPMAIVYIFGAVLYACRLPERLFPGKFDIFFQSHQILHVCVLVGVILHHHGLHKSFIYATTKQHCPIPNRMVPH